MNPKLCDFANVTTSFPSNINPVKLLLLFQHTPTEMKTSIETETRQNNEQNGAVDSSLAGLVKSS